MYNTYTEEFDLIVDDNMILLKDIKSYITKLMKMLMILNIVI